MAAMDETPPFHPARFQHEACCLLPMNPEWATRFGEGLASIDPWSRLGYSAATLTRYLAGDTPERRALAVLVDGTPVACLAIRPHWLRGPLLELLAVLPTFQGGGLGRKLILWLAEETRRQGQTELWTLVSAFNLSARAFYLRQGFDVVGELPGLIRPDETEILLRLRLNRG